jgi:hypothetical protein
LVFLDRGGDDGEIVLEVEDAVGVVTDLPLVDDAGIVDAHDDAVPGVDGGGVFGGLGAPLVVVGLVAEAEVVTDLVVEPGDARAGVAGGVEGLGLGVGEDADVAVADAGVVAGDREPGLGLGGEFGGDVDVEHGPDLGHLAPGFGDVVLLGGVEGGGV